MKEYIIIAVTACIFGLLIVALRNSKALKKFVLNSFAGFAAMGAVNLAAITTNIGIGVNVWTLLIAAFLGVPGVTGIMFLRLIWHI